MIRGKCPKCGKVKWLTKHSKKGHHKKPYQMICRKCHDKEHGIVIRKIGKKYQPGTPKFKRKNEK